MEDRYKITHEQGFPLCGPHENPKKYEERLKEHYSTNKEALLKILENDKRMD